MSKKSEKEAERNEAIAELHKILKPGDKVYTIVRHVARSGMSRDIDVYACQVDEKGEPYMRYLSGYVAKAIDVPRAKSGALKMGGCGMDMCFQTVYLLGRALFPDGGPLDKSDVGRQAQERRSGETRERDGGYLLRKEDL